MLPDLCDRWARGKTATGRWIAKENVASQQIALACCTCEGHYRTRRRATAHCFLGRFLPKLRRCQKHRRFFVRHPVVRWTPNRAPSPRGLHCLRRFDRMEAAWGMTIGPAATRHDTTSAGRPGSVRVGYRRFRRAACGGTGWLGVHTPSPDPCDRGSGGRTGHAAGRCGNRSNRAVTGSHACPGTHPIASAPAGGPCRSTANP